MAPDSEPSSLIQAAWQSEELFRQLVKGAMDYAIFLLVLEGFVVSWNTGAELITGYSEDEILGKNLEVFYTTDDIAAGKPISGLAVALQEGRIEDEGWRRRKDNTLFWGNVVLTLIQDEKGRCDHHHRRAGKDRIPQQGGRTPVRI
jgi:PAS domain S-box-containing protein